MPSCRTSGTGKIKKQGNIELISIIKFIKFIQALAWGMLGISTLGIILVGKNKEAQVLYTMVIITNLLVVIGGQIPIRILENKNK